MFRHGTELARVLTVKEEDSAVISTMSRDQFIAACPVRFVEDVGDNKTRPAPPPTDVLQHVYLTPPDLPLPYLAGVTRVPTFGADGSMQNEPGYSHASMSHYVAPVGLVIPPVGEWGGNLRDMQVARAKRLLVHELLADFPFDGWDRTRIMTAYSSDEGEKLPASLLNAIALLLTPLCSPYDPRANTYDSGQ